MPLGGLSKPYRLRVKVNIGSKELDSVSLIDLSTFIEHCKPGY